MQVVLNGLNYSSVITKCVRAYAWDNPFGPLFFCCRGLGVFQTIRLKQLLRAKRMNDANGGSFNKQLM